MENEENPITEKMDKVKEKFQKIPLPNAKPDEKVICMYNKYSQKVCYGLPTRNVIQCDDDQCKINYNSYDRTLLHNTFPDGVNIGLKPNGAFSKLHIFGVFPKNDLETINTIFGHELPIEKTEKVSNPTFDLPEPPKKCKWAIWSDQCQPYVKDLDWKWKPFKGWYKDTP